MIQVSIIEKERLNNLNNLKLSNVFINLLHSINVWYFENSMLAVGTVPK